MDEAEKKRIAWEYVQNYVGEQYPHWRTLGPDDLKAAVREALDSLMWDLRLATEPKIEG